MQRLNIYRVNQKVSTIKGRSGETCQAGLTTVSNDLQTNTIPWRSSLMVKGTDYLAPGSLEQSYFENCSRTTVMCQPLRGDVCVTASDVIVKSHSQPLSSWSLSYQRTSPQRIKKGGPIKDNYSVQTFPRKYFPLSHNVKAT